DAVSAGYAHRLFLPATLWAALWNATTGVEADRFAEEVRAALGPAVNLLGQEPARAYLAAAEADRLTLPLVAPTRWPSWFYAPGQAWSPGDPDDHPAGFVLRVHRDGLARLYELLSEPPPDLLSDVERALRSTLDTATHRVDPWLTGMAARRLDLLAAKPDTRFR